MMGMGFLTKFTGDQPQRAPAQSLEDLLIDLQRFGQPYLSMHNSGWHCSIKMHVAAVGATFDVRSEFGHATPSSAVRDCAERVAAALATMQRGKP